MNWQLYWLLRSFQSTSWNKLYSCQAHKFVLLLSANHRCVLWPVDQWECTIFVALNLWVLLHEPGCQCGRYGFQLFYLDLCFIWKLSLQPCHCANMRNNQTEWVAEFIKMHQKERLTANSTRTRAKINSKLFLYRTFNINIFPFLKHFLQNYLIHLGWH